MGAPKGNKYGVANKGGRPLIYDDDRLDEEAKALLEWIQTDSDDKIYLGTFALQRGYDRWKLSEWADRHEGFRLAYRQAKTWQENKFTKNGLTKKWDPTFTQFVMARVCAPEWKKSWDQPEEKQDQNVNVIVNKIEQ